MTNAFDTSGPSIIGRDMERDAKNRRKGAKMVEKLRRQGKEPMNIRLTKTPATDKFAKDVILKEGKQI